jgi:catalase
VDQTLAEAVADGLGISPLPEPLPKAAPVDVVPEVINSPALSLTARPGDGRIAARRVAILVADGVDPANVTSAAARLREEGAVPRILAPRLGKVGTSNGEFIEADGTVASMPSVLFDAVMVGGGVEAVQVLLSDGRVPEFLKDQYRHCKPMLMLGESVEVLKAAGIPLALVTGDADPGLLVDESGDSEEVLDAFVQAIAGHRVFERETDPPVI